MAEEFETSIINEVSNLNSFVYFNMLSALIKKYSKGFQSLIIECFNRCKEKNQDLNDDESEDGGTTNKNPVQDKSINKKGKILISGYKDYWVQLNKEIVSKLFLRMCIIEIDSSKRYLNRQNWLQKGKIEIIHKIG